MRLIDADKIPWRTTETIGDNPVKVQLVLKQSIDTMPTIEVVRCKECKHQFTSECYCVREYYVNGKEFAYPGDNFFCKKGERR